ncbi:MAG TPA: hypothetical protein VJR04_09685 [Terriglobales bacterium]|nr:hypothetical protein [Terriglobales bacterium]
MNLRFVTKERTTLIAIKAMTELFATGYRTELKFEANQAILAAHNAGDR